MLINDIYLDIGYFFYSLKEKYYLFFILVFFLYLNLFVYEFVYYIYISCKFSNFLMFNFKNNFGFIFRVNFIFFVNIFGIWIRDKLVYFFYFSIGMVGLNSYGVMIL